LSGIDQLDVQILAKLTANARAGVAEIATALGISRATVQIRMRRLESEGILVGFQPIINLPAVGMPVQALVSLEIDQRLMPSIVRGLQALPAVLEVRIQAGREDLLVQVAIGSLEEHQKLTAAIVAIDGVRKTTSTFTVSTPVPYRVQPLLNEVARGTGWGRSTPASPDSGALLPGYPDLRGCQRVPAVPPLYATAVSGAAHPARPSHGNDLSASSDTGKVSQILTSDGYTMTGGSWTKNGKPIKFSIEDPSSYTGYAADAQLIADQLNSEGFEVSFDGVQAAQWYSDVAAGNFQAVLRWSNQGPTPWDYFDLWMDSTLSAPIGKPAGGDFGRYDNPQVQSLLAQYTGTDSTAKQQGVLDKLEAVMATQAPVIPLVYGAAWYEYSTKDYTGSPSATNAYIDPVPNAPYMEYTLLHLTPAS
jgi:DNA-binding Lrp family transcriptional regulator